MANDTTEKEGKALSEIFKKDTTASNVINEALKGTLPEGKKEKYIYSMPDCPKCEKRKTYLRENHINFFDRKGERLSGDTRLMDKIDKEAHLQLQMQNLTFPVELDIIAEYE